MTLLGILHPRQLLATMHVWMLQCASGIRHTCGTLRLRRLQQAPLGSALVFHLLPFCCSGLNGQEEACAGCEDRFVLLDAVATQPCMQRVLAEPKQKTQAEKDADKIFFCREALCMGHKFQPKCVLDDDLCEVLLWIVANNPPRVVLPLQSPARFTGALRCKSMATGCNL